MQTPSVGRIVHYFNYGNTHPTAAIIVGICPEETLVNLYVFDGGGSNTFETSVPLLQDDSVDRPLTPYCEWPPRF